MVAERIERFTPALAPVIVAVIMLATTTCCGIPVSMAVALCWQMWIIMSAGAVVLSLICKLATKRQRDAAARNGHVAGLNQATAMLESADESLLELRVADRGWRR